MLPPVNLPQSVKNASGKAVTLAMIAALAIAAAAPAQALGRNERNFLTGVVATLVVKSLIDQTRRPAPTPRYTAPQPQYIAPQQYITPERQYLAPQPVYGRVIGDNIGTSLYRSPAAEAFNNYRLQDRRAIQRRLATLGYYRSGIDGAFGPGTFGAVQAYARANGTEQRLATRDGAFGIFDSLLY